MKFKQYLNEYGPSKVDSKQQKQVDDMKKKGFIIAMWDADFVGMVDKKGNPAEVYPDGTVKYPKKISKKEKEKFEKNTKKFLGLK